MRRCDESKGGCKHWKGDFIHPVKKRTREDLEEENERLKKRIKELEKK